MLKPFLLSSVLLAGVGCQISREAAPDEFGPVQKEPLVAAPLVSAPAAAAIGVPMDTLKTMPGDSTPKDPSFVPATAKADSLVPGAESGPIRHGRHATNGAGTHKASSTGRPRPLKAPTTPTHGISLEAIPRTLQEAQELSRALWAAAQPLSRTNPDSALQLTSKALRTFENGSLFYFKSFLLLQRNEPSGALTAAERSISLSDHWDNLDLAKAYGVRAQALEALYKRFPSDPLSIKKDAAMNQYRMLTHESQH